MQLYQRVYDIYLAFTYTTSTVDPTKMKTSCPPPAKKQEQRRELSNCHETWDTLVSRLPHEDIHLDRQTSIMTTVSSLQNLLSEAGGEFMTIVSLFEDLLEYLLLLLETIRGTPEHLFRKHDDQDSSDDEPPPKKARLMDDGWNESARCA